MTGILGLYLALVALLAQIDGRVTVETLPAPWDVVMGPDEVRTGVTGQAFCYGTYAHLLLYRGATTETLVHEYAHAWDCVDNGAFDGSPLPTDADLSILHPFWSVVAGCHRNSIERYACWFVEAARKGLVP